MVFEIPEAAQDHIFEWAGLISLSLLFVMYFLFSFRRERKKYDEGLRKGIVLGKVRALSDMDSTESAFYDDNDEVDETAFIMGNPDIYDDLVKTEDEIYAELFAAPSNGAHDRRRRRNKSQKKKPRRKRISVGVGV